MRFARQSSKAIMVNLQRTSGHQERKGDKTVKGFPKGRFHVAISRVNFPFPNLSVGEGRKIMIQVTENKFMPMEISFKSYI